MAEISVKFEMDEKLKKEFDVFCDGVGLSISSAFSLFAKKAVTEQKIPFEISVDPFYSAENMERLERAVANLRAGKGKVHEVVYEEDLG